MLRNVLMLIVVVARTFIATVDYESLGYETVEPAGYATTASREDLMVDLIHRLENGQVWGPYLAGGDGRLTETFSLLVSI